MMLTLDVNGRALLKVVVAYRGAPVANILIPAKGRAVQGARSEISELSRSGDPAHGN
jgi:hypothetical protein